jgi:N-acetylneuraminate synthase
MAKTFPYPIGYSDHSEGIEISIAAVALGATIIEKHFTLDSTLIGMDNHMAIEPEEMKNLVNSCNNIFMGLGGTVRSLSKVELKQRKKMRRSIIVNKNMKKGSIITQQDIDLKRPGTGLPPNDIEKIIGKKLKNNIPIGQLLMKKDIK